MWVIVSTIFIVGTLVTIILYLICYQISQFYVSKQYILKEVESGRKTKIVGDSFEISYNDYLVSVCKDEGDIWIYTIKEKTKLFREPQKLVLGEYIEIGDIKFEILIKKKVGLIVLLPIGIITISSMLLLSQGLLLINRDTEEAKTNETTEFNKDSIQENKAEKSPEMIPEEVMESDKDRQEDDDIQEEIQFLDENDKIVDMHTLVLENDDLFQDNISVDWSMCHEENGRFSFENSSSETGISVSKYQEEIDWEKVKLDGIDYVLIRIGSRGTETGNLYEDSRFSENMVKSKANGLKVGGYFYSQAIDQKELDEEIEMILDALQGYTLDYPIGIGLERKVGYRTMNLSDDEYVELIKYFCIRIKQSGYTPMIMGRDEWFKEFSEETFKGYLKLVTNINEFPQNIDNCIIWEYQEAAKNMVNSIDKVELSVSIYANFQND